MDDDKTRNRLLKEAADFLGLALDELSSKPADFISAVCAAVEADDFMRVHNLGYDVRR